MYDVSYVLVVLCFFFGVVLVTVMWCRLRPLSNHEWKDQGHLYSANSVNKTFVALIDDVECEIMQENATYNNNVDAKQQVVMDFCCEGDQWCSITGTRAKCSDFWVQVRAKHKSEEGMTWIKFQRIMLQETVPEAPGEH